MSAVAISSDGPIFGQSGRFVYPPMSNPIQPSIGEYWANKFNRRSHKSSLQLSQFVRHKTLRIMCLCLTCCSSSATIRLATLFQMLGARSPAPADINDCNDGLCAKTDTRMTNMRFKLKVTINGTDTTSEYFEQCCVHGCGSHAVEELSECVECGQYFCIEHDCACQVENND